ncbi:MAG: polysaccharide deacetylase family protein [Bacteroidetes bacterium]|nr:polysaccharide deacetylase family protein [Bacteroidota bacterium]
MYFVRTPYIIKRLMPSITWEISNEKNAIFLTFDDGPHPEITPWILKQLKAYNAKATFFCLGKNAEQYPNTLKQILEEGHTIGSHGYAHLNGWKTSDDIYLEDVNKSFEVLQKMNINTQLFRPAYGRISLTSLKKIQAKYAVINWSLMPGDFDSSITSEKCLSNLQRIKSGDIIVLHDNEKSWKHLNYCLPKFLEFCKTKKFHLESIPSSK